MSETKDGGKLVITSAMVSLALEALDEPEWGPSDAKRMLGSFEACVHSGHVPDEADAGLVRHYARSAINGFDTLDSKTAFANAKSDLDSILRLLAHRSKGREGA